MAIILKYIKEIILLNLHFYIGKMQMWNNTLVYRISVESKQMCIYKTDYTDNLLGQW